MPSPSIDSEDDLEEKDLQNKGNQRPQQFEVEKELNYNDHDHVNNNEEEERDEKMIDYNTQEVVEKKDHLEDQGHYHHYNYDNEENLQREDPVLDSFTTHLLLFKKRLDRDPDNKDPFVMKLLEKTHQPINTNPKQIIDNQNNNQNEEFEQHQQEIINNRDRFSCTSNSTSSSSNSLHSKKKTKLTTTIEKID